MAELGWTEAFVFAGVVGLLVAVWASHPEEGDRIRYAVDLLREPQCIEREACVEETCVKVTKCWQAVEVTREGP